LVVGGTCVDDRMILYKGLTKIMMMMIDDDEDDD